MRHEVCYWGEVEEECLSAPWRNHQSKELALVSGLRLFSDYHCIESHSVYGDRIYIITEADRSVTPVLWPREY